MKRTNRAKKVIQTMIDLLEEEEKENEVKKVFVTITKRGRDMYDQLYENRKNKGLIDYMRRRGIFEDALQLLYEKEIQGEGKNEKEDV